MRTPLFRHLQRALALARVANATGEPPEEVVGRWREARARRPGRAAISRRRFLATAGAAAAGLAAGCRPGARARSAAAGEPLPVAIVGAGIAGLTAGYRLRQAGITFRVFEGQERVGGRIWSLRDRFPEGQVCELGGELVDSNHEALHALCAELELPLDDFSQDDPALLDDLWFFGGRRVPDEEVVAAFRPIAAAIDAAWESVTAEDITYRTPGGGDLLDRLSIDSWLDGVGCEGFFRELLDVAYTTEYGLEIEEQSAWNLLAMIDTDPDPFRVFGDSDERFHVRGGNHLVPQRLAERLGDAIATGARLERLAQRADGAYELDFRRGGRSEVIAAARVVLTIPFTMLREVRLDVELPYRKRRAIAELGYGTNAKLMVGFSERLWRTAGGSNGSVLSDLPFQLVWESTRLQDGRGGILVCFTGGRRGLEIGKGTAEEQAVAFARELERVFPGVANLRTDQVRFHWPSSPWVKGSYACYRPGQWTDFRGVEGERVGNLHFAGEHTSLGFQGFMEGGCESGERVAREILADLGLAAETAA